MARDDAHLVGCPKGTDPSAHCQCEAIEDRMIARASMPAPAELIRRAIQRGWIKKGHPYQAAP